MKVSLLFFLVVLTTLNCFSQFKLPSTDNSQMPKTRYYYDGGWYRIDMSDRPFSAIFYDDFKLHDGNNEEKIPYSPYTPFLREESKTFWHLPVYDPNKRDYETKIENERMKIEFHKTNEGWIPLLYNPLVLADYAFDIRVIIDKESNSAFSGVFIGTKRQHDGIHFSITNKRTSMPDCLGIDYYSDDISTKSENIKDVTIWPTIDNELRIKKEGEKVNVYVNGFKAYEFDKSDLKDYSQIALIATGDATNNKAIFKSAFVNIMSDISGYFNKGVENKNIVNLKKNGGIYSVPVDLNNVLKIDFIFDSGASDVSISPDVALTLIKTGTIKKEDWLEGSYYKFADGSIAKSKRFKLSSIKIGNKVLKNVTCSISNSIDAPMLLGQSVLSKFGKYTFDNVNQKLIIE